MTSIEIPTPDDWHVHLRDDEMLEAVVSYSARRFRYVMVMPNLRPPIVTAGQAEAYRDRILACAPPGEGHDFLPLMTLFMSPDVDLEDLRRGAEAGIVAAVKYYPVGATTNSDQAAGALGDYGDLLEQLIELDMRLLVHAESTRPDVDLFDREAAFLHDELGPVCERFPELRVTVEHVSTRAGVDFVAAHPQAAATVTPHHLARQRDDLLAHGMQPDLYCKPVLNTFDDQLALVKAATSGDPSFMLGTDSAPHATSAKYAPRVAAGIFNASYGLEVVAEVFHRAGALDNLAAFVSQNGLAIYGVEPPPTSVRLTRTPPTSPPTDRFATATGDEVVMFGIEEAQLWEIESGG